MPVKVTLNCKLQSDKFEALQIFLEENLPNVRGFEGCRNVTVYFSEDKESMLLDETWASAEAHQKYIQFITEKGVLDKLVEFLSGPPEIQYFTKADL